MMRWPWANHVTGGIRHRQEIPQSFVLNHTDEHSSYQGLPSSHETVQHSVSEYVNGQAHVNGMESFWALLKRRYHGTFHHMSP